MARIRGSKWRAGQESIQIKQEDDDVSHHLQHSYPQATQEMIDDTMKHSISDDDTESDHGGVSLDMNTGDTLMENNTSIHTVAEAEYLQQAITLSSISQGQLWERPPGKLLRKAMTKKRPELAVARTYEQCHRLLKKHWGCDFEDCIPDHLRTSTPYSLGLLSAVRRLASTSKGNYEVGQAAMSRAWTQRICQSQNETPTREVQYSFVETRPTVGKHSESAIQENIYGLMIADVYDALEKLKSKTYLDLPTPKEMRQVQRAARGGGQSKGTKKDKQKKVRADRVAKKQAQLQTREADLRARLVQLCRPGDRDDDGSSTAVPPPNSPVQSNKGLESLSQHFRLSSSCALQRSATSQPDEEPTSNLSGNDRANYQKMANMLSNIYVDYNDVVNKKRIKKLRKGGFSRNQASALLPSEKTNLSNLATLPAMPARVSGLTAEELTKLSKLSLDDLPG